MFESMRWRLVGPFRGGRATAVVGHPEHRLEFFFGAATGGVWKTENGGGHWYNVSDGMVRAASVGALAIADSDPNIVYVGTGEACVRNDVATGDGVYRSDDGGTSWRHVGLDQTQHIARIRVHPKNANYVLVAALGRVFGRSSEGGIYRSYDGGRQWDCVLAAAGATGAADVIVDPTNPRIVFASLWDVQRTPWSFTSGGEHSALYKSADGGESWARLDENQGMPAGPRGRIGVAVAPTCPARIYAVVEAVEGGLFRSDDGGRTWNRTNGGKAVRQRPWYFSHVVAHPTDPDTVYVLGLDLYKSIDGGFSFQRIMTLHGDHHDLWIDPRDPDRMISAHDGGATVSFNGGRHWSTVLNQPTGQFYGVSVDRERPYRIYGTQQDSGSLSVPSRSPREAIGQAEWYDVGGGEGGQVVVHPDEPRIIYANSYNKLTRYDHKSGEVRIISPWPEDYHGWPASAVKYRFAWSFPVLLSPHDSSVLYTAAQVVFRSTNEGASWEVISPDLTRNDPSKMALSGGPITPDNTGAEYFGTIVALAESPCRRGLLWAGSDDGRVHKSDDNGRTWEDVTPPQLPEWSYVTAIEPSAHDPKIVYVAAHRYKLGDRRPFLFRTTDAGDNWEPVTKGVPDTEFIRVVRQDPWVPGLLYLGTEVGVYVSCDHAHTWHPLGRGLPRVPIYGLAVADHDLVAGTHGRAFWVLDDIEPLRQWSGLLPTDQPHVFTPAPACMWVTSRPFGREKEGQTGQISLRNSIATWYRERVDGHGLRFYDAGENPPVGLWVSYWLPSVPYTSVRLTIRSSTGDTVAQFSSEASDNKGGWFRDAVLPRDPGINRFLWDLRSAAPYWGADFGDSRILAPLVIAGEYELELNVDGRLVTTKCSVCNDPRIHLAVSDAGQRRNLSLDIWRLLNDVNRIISHARMLMHVAQLHKRFATATGRGEGLIMWLESVAASLEKHSVALKSGESHDDVVGLPASLYEKLLALYNVVESSYTAPSIQAMSVYEWLRAQCVLHIEGITGLGTEIEKKLFFGRPPDNVI